MRAWVILAGVLCAGSALAAGAKPVGLVLSYTGAAPALAPYTELMAESEFDLGSDTVSFVHYGTCKSVEVKGGKLKVGTDHYQAEGASKELGKDQCPEQVAVVARGVSGGVLLRSAPSPEIPPRLECVLAGNKRKAFAAVQVMDGSGVLLQIPLTGERIALPANVPPLHLNRTYKLNFIPGNPLEPPRSVSVLVSAPTGGNLCLLRID